LDENFPVEAIPSSCRIERLSLIFLRDQLLTDLGEFLEKHLREYVTIQRDSKRRDETRREEKRREEIQR
jgi:hypothetical protein